ncbi:hypothetical protein [Rhodohalobacter sulfatireducens]|uniref:Lipoprotein n=1 Tax=Rhodohalobacter sulfatireducens TaxID=2911366 RepID=A0ABS9KFR6_9BACT|nr:hypothetical protein [Rhodohalobacter sulfatireducens]MCG2589677.1 hypothetical protein [Rhodohalobacter sulfatireducens]
MKALNQPLSKKVRDLFFLFSLLFVISTACSDNGVGPEEEEPEIIEDQELSITSSSAGKNEGNARWTEYAATDIGNQRMLSRTTVNVAGPGDTKSATAVGYARFYAKADEASLLVDINWKGTLLSAINLSSSTEMIVHLRVRHMNPNGSTGSEIFSRQLERDGIGSGLKALQKLDVESSIRESYELNLTKDELYRVEVSLQCKLQVDIVSFSLVDCNAESDNRGVFVEQLKVMYE